MTIFLSHTTATQCWLSGRFDGLLGGPSIAPRHRPAGAIQVDETATMLAMDRLNVRYGESFAFDGAQADETFGCKPSAREVRALRTEAIAFTSDPTHLMVPGKSAASAFQSAVCHVRTSALPYGSLVRADDGLLLCSPELCFLQMATHLSFLQLIKLGFELCALYTLQPDGQAGYGRIVPPTTVRALETYLERCEGMPGVAAARKALRSVCAASGSPMETALAIILCLPLRLGGYGLPLPRMNYRIDAHRNKRSAGEKHYYLCDLYWPEAGACIEYDSDLEHTGPERIAEDAQRRNDLIALGVTTITATREQVMSAEKLGRIAHQIGALLNVRIRDERGWSPREREKLFRSLVTAKDLEASWSKPRRLAVSTEGR